MSTKTRKRIIWGLLCTGIVLFGLFDIALAHGSMWLSGLFVAVAMTAVSIGAVLALGE